MGVGECASRARRLTVRGGMLFIWEGADPAATLRNPSHFGFAGTGSFAFRETLVCPFLCRAAWRILHGSTRDTPRSLDSLIDEPKREMTH